MGDSRRLGFIGLGNIGGGVCANLLADGHSVTALDTDPEKLKVQVAAGAKAAESAADVARAADITLLSLPTPEIMAAVTESWLTGAGPGKILIDLTTNSPSLVREMGRRVEATGARFVEAPLTGGAIGARNRQLFFIMGGEPDVVAEVTPLLETIGRGTCHLGGFGSGNVGKLFNSLMAFTTQVVGLEGLALAQSNGVDLRDMITMIRTSGGSTSYFQGRVEEIAERGRPPDFSMELAAKDAGLMVALGRESGVPLPVASAVHQMLVFAKAQGLGGHDISDMVEATERASGLRLELRPES
jgi:3-hydroxyisobutyrate dehydrogenase-like beta-hydroxyacid dehydrogenase